MFILHKLRRIKLVLKLHYILVMGFKQFIIPRLNLLLNFLSDNEISKTADYALAAAVQPFAGAIGFTVMAIAAIFSTSSAINATLYGGANVSYLMAKKGKLPRFFIGPLGERVKKV